MPTDSTPTPPDPTPARRRIALYGGSFNPPHHGHVMVATWAVAVGGFDEVRLLPTGAHPFGKALAAFETRCAMAAAAVAHLAPHARVSPIEGDLAQPSYTIDTVRAVLAAEPDVALTWVVGADAYAQRHAWRAWDALETLVEFLVVGRVGSPDPDDRAVPTRFPDISSTEIRRRVAAGAPYDQLTPTSVAAIIAAEGLYR